MIDKILKQKIRSSWSAETASTDGQWSPNNPAAGHCDVTSLLVRERFGGDLRMAKVFRDGELSEYHYWNVLPDGAELDLTSEQFDGTESFTDVTEMDAEFFRTAGPMQPQLVARFELFKQAVDHLSQVGGVDR